MCGFFSWRFEKCRCFMANFRALLYVRWYMHSTLLRTLYVYKVLASAFNGPSLLLLPFLFKSDIPPRIARTNILHYTLYIHCFLPPFSGAWIKEERIRAHIAPPRVLDNGRGNNLWNERGRLSVSVWWAHQSADNGRGNVYAADQSPARTHTRKKVWISNWTLPYLVLTELWVCSIFSRAQVLL